MLGLCLLLAASPDASRAAALTLEDAQAVEGTLRKLTGLRGPEYQAPLEAGAAYAGRRSLPRAAADPRARSRGGRACRVGITRALRLQGNGRRAVQDIGSPRPRS